MTVTSGAWVTTNDANIPDAIACLGEFVGTTLFLFFSLGGTSVALQAANSVTGNVKDGASTFNTSNL